MEGGFVILAEVFEGGLVAEELGDDGGVAPGCGFVQGGVAVVGRGVDWRTTVFYVGAGGEGGGQESAVAFLRGEEEDVVFVFRDEE